MFSGSQSVGQFGICACLVGALTACDFRSPRGVAQAAESGAQPELTEGYSLLYGLLSKEKKAEQILLLKLESEPLGRLVGRISETCEEACEKLEEFAKEDPRVKPGQVSLPRLEQATRKSLETSTAGKLLRSSGLDFEVRFLVSQLSALDYASHLSRVLLKNEESPSRREFLEDLSGKCDELSREVYRLLRSNMRG